MNDTNANHDATTYRGQIARLLDVLAMEIETRNHEGKHSPDDAYADRLHAAREHLVTTIVRLTGMTYSEVYRFVTDAE